MNMEKIKIEELNGNLDKVKILEYVPIRDQLSMIKNIVSSLVVEDEYGVLKYDSVNYEISKKVSIVDLFTNVQITDDDLDNYDYIIKSGLWDKLVGSKNIGEYTFYLDLSLDDKLHENSYENILAKKSSDIVNIIDNTMKHVNMMIDRGDPNYIAKHLSKVADTFIKKMPDFSKLDAGNKNKGVV